MWLQHYGLDPAYNYTSPGLSWQAAFKIINVELHVLTNIGQHLFIEEGPGEAWQWSATDTLEPMPLACKITKPENAIAK